MPIVNPYIQFDSSQNTLNAIFSPEIWDFS